MKISVLNKRTQVCKQTHAQDLNEEIFHGSMNHGFIFQFWLVFNH